jgi:hypothetical protein
MIARQLRILLQVQLLDQQRMRSADIVATVGLRPGFLYRQGYRAGAWVSERRINTPARTPFETRSSEQNWRRRCGRRARFTRNGNISTRGICLGCLCATPYNYLVTAFAFFIRRDFLRAALFLWMTPLTAALSSVLIACWDHSSIGGTACDGLLGLFPQRCGRGRGTIGCARCGRQPRGYAS